MLLSFQFITWSLNVWMPTTSSGKDTFPVKRYWWLITLQLSAFSFLIRNCCEAWRLHWSAGCFLWGAAKVSSVLFLEGDWQKPGHNICWAPFLKFLPSICWAQSSSHSHSECFSPFNLLFNLFYISNFILIVKSYPLFILLLCYCCYLVSTRGGWVPLLSLASSQGFFLDRNTVDNSQHCSNTDVVAVC